MCHTHAIRTATLVYLSNECVRFFSLTEMETFFFTDDDNKKEQKKYDLNRILAASSMLIRSIGDHYRMWVSTCDQLPSTTGLK